MSDQIRDELKQISKEYLTAMNEMRAIADSMTNGSISLKTCNAKAREIDKRLRPFNKRRNELIKLLKTK